MMNNTIFDFSQRPFEFEQAFYVSDRDGRIKLYFTSPTGDEFLLFDSSNFFIEPTAKLPPLDTLHLLTCLNDGPWRIIGARRNEDGDIYLLLNGDTLMKVYFAPDDVYANRCVQLVTMVVPQDNNPHYQDAMQDYLNHSQPL